MAARRGILYRQHKNISSLELKRKKYTQALLIVWFYFSHLIIDNECFVVVVTRYISNPVGSIPQEKPEKKI